MNTVLFWNKLMNSKNKEDCFFESHKKYIDIQYVFEGEEIMEVENLSNLQVTTAYKRI